VSLMMKKQTTNQSVGGAMIMNSMDWIMVAMIAATAAIAVYCSVTGCGMDTYENYYGDDK